MHSGSHPSGCQNGTPDVMHWPNVQWQLASWHDYNNRVYIIFTKISYLNILAMEILLTISCKVAGHRRRIQRHIPTTKTFTLFWRLIKNIQCWHNKTNRNDCSHVTTLFIHYLNKSWSPDWRYLSTVFYFTKTSSKIMFPFWHIFLFPQLCIVQLSYQCTRSLHLDSQE